MLYIDAIHHNWDGSWQTNYCGTWTYYRADGSLKNEMEIALTRPLNEIQNLKSALHIAKSEKS